MGSGKLSEKQLRQREFGIRGRLTPRDTQPSLHLQNQCDLWEEENLAIIESFLFVGCGQGPFVSDGQVRGGDVMEETGQM